MQVPVPAVECEDESGAEKELREDDDVAREIAAEFASSAPGGGDPSDVCGACSKISELRMRSHRQIISSFPPERIDSGSSKQNHTMH